MTRPTGSPRTCHIHAVALVLSRVVRPIRTGAHVDPVEAQQSPVENHEHLAATDVNRLIEGDADAARTWIPWQA